MLVKPADIIHRRFISVGHLHGGDEKKEKSRSDRPSRGMTPGLHLENASGRQSRTHRPLPSSSLSFSPLSLYHSSPPLPMHPSPPSPFPFSLSSRLPGRPGDADLHPSGCLHPPLSNPSHWQPSHHRLLRPRSSHHLPRFSSHPSHLTPDPHPLRSRSSHSSCLSSRPPSYSLSLSLPQPVSRRFLHPLLSCLPLRPSSQVQHSPQPRAGCSRLTPKLRQADAGREGR